MLDPGNYNLKYIYLIMYYVIKHNLQFNSYKKKLRWNNATFSKIRVAFNNV